MLSVLIIMRQDTALVASKNMQDLLTRPEPLSTDLGTGVRVDAGGEGNPLRCLCHSNHEVFNGTIFRIVCSSEAWHASSAMRSRRRRMRLSFEFPDFSAVFAFTTEALSAFPQSGIAGCVDFAYSDGDRPRDFNEWAIAQQLVGIDRVYVADQLRYRSQVRDQVDRGFAFLTHDYPHRYVTAGARDGPQPPTTYEMFYRTTSAYNLLCLHEHWYDDWILVSYSTDEFITFLGATEPPSKPEALMGAAIQRVWEKLGVPEDKRRGGWARRPRHPLCTSQLCVNRPFYGPSHLVQGEIQAWTLPGNVPGTPTHGLSVGPRLHYGSATELSIERFSRRFRVLPPKGSVRKCFVHPDWRLGSRLKVHGFKMQSCPLARTAGAHGGVPACVRAWPGLRALCLELCGTWGNETAPLNNSCPGFTNDGMLIRGVELAHFRVAPDVNQVKGYEETKWLSSLAGPVRTAMRQIKRPTVGPESL